MKLPSSDTLSYSFSKNENGAILAMDKLVMEYISKKITESVPAISIILGGSRARGDHHEDSDYDIVIVMNTLLVPFYLKRIERLEVELIKSLGVDVNLKPLPSLQIRNSANNPYISKMKREGIVLYGRDFLKDLSNVNQDQTDTYWHFYHLFSLMRQMIEPYQPKKSLDASITKANSKVARELLDLSLVAYSENVINILQQINSSKNEASLSRWFVIRGILIKSFEQLLKLTLKTENVGDPASGYLRASKQWKSMLKNLEYVLLILLLRHELRFKSLLTKPLITHRIGVAVLLLLMSVGEDESINPAYVERAYDLLKDCTDVQYHEDVTGLWMELKMVALSNWPYAMTTMGF
jgi:predicted nucleotidyltransferase